MTVTSSASLWARYTKTREDKSAALCAAGAAPAAQPFLDLTDAVIRFCENNLGIFIEKNADADQMIITASS